MAGAALATQDLADLLFLLFRAHVSKAREEDSADAIVRVAGSALGATVLQVVVQTNVNVSAGLATGPFRSASRVSSASAGTDDQNWTASYGSPGRSAGMAGAGGRGHACVLARLAPVAERLGATRM